MNYGLDVYDLLLGVCDSGQAFVDVGRMLAILARLCFFDSGQEFLENDGFWRFFGNCKNISAVGKLSHVEIEQLSN